MKSVTAAVTSHMTGDIFGEELRMIRYLQRPGPQFLGDAQLIARMGGEGVVGGQLLGNLLGKLGTEPAAAIDAGQFLQLAVRVFVQLAPLHAQVCMFGIGL